MFGLVFLHRFFSLFYFSLFVSAVQQFSGDFSFSLLLPLGLLCFGKQKFGWFSYSEITNEFLMKQMMLVFASFISFR